MRIRTGAVLVLLLAFGGGLAAAENPFVGTWKLNPAKSKLTGDTMKFEKTASGAIRTSASGFSYTFNVDGKEYTGPFGRVIVWKQIDDHTWETTYKFKGNLLRTETSKLSPDGKTLTVVDKGTRPNGEKFEETTVYARIAGEKGLLGGWRDKAVKISSPVTVEIKPSGQDGLLITSVGYKWTEEAKFDGKDYPVTGPTLPAGLTVVLKHTGPRSFERVRKQNGKPLFRDTVTVSPDGRTLTIAGSAVAVNEPYTGVFERQ
jgi:WD40 repeat protein